MERGRGRWRIGGGEGKDANLLPFGRIGGRGGLGGGGFGGGEEERRVRTEEG